MKYNSTRNKNTVVTAAQAISQGISEEGGLFVPQELPKYSADELLALSKLDIRAEQRKFLQISFQTLQQKKSAKV